jgi:hypothetical protein
VGFSLNIENTWRFGVGKTQLLVVASSWIDEAPVSNLGDSLSAK